MPDTAHARQSSKRGGVSYKRGKNMMLGANDALHLWDHQLGGVAHRSPSFPHHAGRMTQRAFGSLPTAQGPGRAG